MAIESRLASMIVTALVTCLAPTGATAQQADRGGAGKACSATAEAVFDACRKQVEADYALARAKCMNISDDAERARCFADAKEARREDDQLCREQLALRRDACRALGEGRYDPNIDPALFDDPKHPTNPNAYFPLAVGDRWVYASGNESDVVEVVDETKRIAGVGCIVVRDVVSRDGFPAEATDDWYAHAKDGTTWYFGEEEKDYETFEGDNPKRPELVDISGSFKAGRENDKPGRIFLASPSVGDVYLEEFSLGNAEDVTEVLSTSYAFGHDPELDEFVPRALAERFCSGDCVVTKNYSLLEPGQFARKYYAPGVGVVLEVELPDGKAVQLVDCNFDPRCAGLPNP